MPPLLQNVPAIAWTRAKLTEWLTVDVRSLAALRIGLALLALLDLADRIPQLTAHYTDAGILPRAALSELGDGWLSINWSFTIHTWSGGAVWQAVLFALAGLALLALLAGYRTRLATIVVWLHLISVQNRNPIILNSADALMRLLFFWGMFLPLGACWSMDARRSQASPLPSPRFRSVAVVGLFTQIVVVYWFTAALKTGDEWRVDGTAIYYALSIDQYATPLLGALLYTTPGVMKAMTFAVFWFEALGPFLLFSPVGTAPLRAVGALLFVGFHAGIFLTLSLGAFPWVSSVAMLCFLPPWFWEKLAAGAGKLAGANPLAAFLTRTITQPSAARADAPPPARKSPWSVMGNILAALALITVLLWNFKSVYPFRLPRVISRPSCFLRIDQAWEMFAPYPLKDDGWYVIPATLRNGKQIDLMPSTRGDFGIREGVTWEKPVHVADAYTNERWRKYFMNLWLGAENQRTNCARYLCRAWNSCHPDGEQIDRLSIYFMLEIAAPDYRHVTPEKTLLIEHRCE